MKNYLFLFFLFCCLPNIGYGDTTVNNSLLNFIDLVDHYDEFLHEGEVIQVKTPPGLALRKALFQINSLPSGNKIFDSVIQNKTRIKFVQVSKKTDPDMVVAFRVGFEDSGNNTIFYYCDVDHWKRITLSSKKQIKGEEISSSSLASLIFHEFGHTDFARQALGLKPDSADNWSKRLDSEREAVNLFENIYRSYYDMPLRKSYFTTDDMLPSIL